MVSASVRPKIGVVLGDPAGIGPELVARLLAAKGVGRHAAVVVMGSREYFDDGQRVAGVKVALDPLQRIGDLGLAKRPLFLEIPASYVGHVPLGEESVSGGRSALVSLCFALQLAQAGEIDGIVYGPLNKASMHLAGSPHPDELRFFAHELGWTGPVGEHNVLGRMWTSRVTSHVPLSEVSSLVTQERVLGAIRLLDSSLKRASVTTPRIAVAALNPHAGDKGLFGSEEASIIGPAIDVATHEGIAAFGPYPADTIFLRVKRERFDGVVSMYHDQGQTATKLLGFDRGVTIAGGLPIAIATPAHGTAFDISGRGIADVGAMKQAFRLVVRLAKHRRNTSGAAFPKY